jgi:hypothetical protein
MRSPPCHSSRRRLGLVDYVVPDAEVRPGSTGWAPAVPGPPHRRLHDTRMLRTGGRPHSLQDALHGPHVPPLCAALMGRSSRGCTAHGAASYHAAGLLARAAAGGADRAQRTAVAAAGQGGFDWLRCSQGLDTALAPRRRCGRLSGLAPRVPLTAPLYSWPSTGAWTWIFTPGWPLRRCGAAGWGACHMSLTRV